MSSASTLTSAALNELTSGLKSTKWSFLVALGAGCLVGASGMVLIQRLNQRLERPHERMSRELASLHLTILDLQEAITELKEGRYQPPRKSALRSVTFSDQVEVSRPGSPTLTSTSFFTARQSSENDTANDFKSELSSEEDEFFDLPSDSDERDELVESLQTILETRIENQKGQNGHLPEGDRDLVLFERVDALLEGDRESQALALQLLKQEQRRLGQNCQHLWRHCKATYFASTAAGLGGDSGQKKALIDEAVELGVKAIEADDGNAEAHKWYAIAVGSRGEFVGVKEKILDGFEFKRHVTRAAELAPKDHTVQHLLGRFCYEVAELSWWERKMAATLFAEPPTATMEEAERHFLEAERLKPEGWKENRHFLAKALLKMQNIEEGVRWLEKADELPVRNPDDSQAQDDINALLVQYQSYRS